MTPASKIRQAQAWGARGRALEPGLFLFTEEKKEKKDESGKQAAWVYKLFPLSSYWGCEEVMGGPYFNCKDM